VTEQVSHPYKTTLNILYILIFIHFGWQTGREKIFDAMQERNSPRYYQELTN
jgi:hypothetical protein